MQVLGRPDDVATALAGRDAPALVQELVPHNGVITKVYVIDQDVWVRARRSLPADLCSGRT